MKMIKLTKEPESCPVDIAPDGIAAYHPWVNDVDLDMCVKVYLTSGAEILVSECMRDIRELLKTKETK
tara:strand:+ start:100 stop:303 length:204 start_codon:yes stop_codon:yes gene_type:complete